MRDRCHYIYVVKRDRYALDKDKTLSLLARPINKQITSKSLTITSVMYMLCVCVCVCVCVHACVCVCVFSFVGP